ncbi:glucose/galactose MFS transporter [Cyclobacteriaceae bacterium]|nr:glucose/galactose MFS transporter [Cyclobacteriaceae bacterium]
MERSEKNKKSASIYFTSYKKPLTLINLMFLAWGFMTVVNSYLLDTLKPELGLSLEYQLFNNIFFGTFFLMALPAAYLIRAIGYKKAFLSGLALASASVLFMVPGAHQINLTLVCIAIFVMASGFTLLQVAANPYILITGEPRKGSARLSLAGAFNSFGAWLAPFIGMIITTLEATNTQSSASLVIKPYILLSTIFIGIAVLLYYSDLPNLKSSNEINTNIKNDQRKFIVQYPHVILGAIAIFCYVGSEMVIFKTLNDSYIVDELGLDTLEKVVLWIVPFYWGGMMFGRFVGNLVLKFYTPAKVLVVCSVFAILLSLSGMYNTSFGALFSVLGLGIFHSVMWPIIFKLGTHGLGKFIEFGSALLIMGIVGGAFIPEFSLSFFPEFGRTSLMIPIICYAFILIYGIFGHRYNKIEEY